MGSPVSAPDPVADLVLDEPTLGDTVYRPQEDSYLLLEAMRTQAAHIRGRRVLDMCCGSGVIGIAAARLGAGAVVAVDTNPHAVHSTVTNARRAGVDLVAVSGSLAEADELGPFDIVLSNPPYVPAPPDIPIDFAIRTSSEAMAARAWDAGHDGRGVLDALCTAMPDLLAPDGMTLLVQSESADPDTTITMLEAAGLRADIIAEARIRLGPIMSERASWLAQRGLLSPDAQTELLSVVRGRR